MTKLKNPLLAFGAVGRLGNAITLRRRGRQTIVEKTPLPIDARSAGQLTWRHMYQKAVDMWHALSAAEKQEWESLARPKHMTGFAWFLSQCLKPNPGIYLPLQGGTMQGDIDMAKHRLLKLPEPVDDQEAARKMDLNGAPAAADYPMKLNPAVTRYVIPGWYINSKAGTTAFAGWILYIPIFVLETTTYTRICILVLTLAVGTADLRIFNWTNGLPSSLVLSAGTVNTGTPGPKEIVISQQLTRGYYFLAVRCTASPLLNGPSPSSAIAPPVSGIDTSSEPKPYRIIPGVETTYADPAPAPTAVFAIDKAMVYLKET